MNIQPLRKLVKRNIERRVVDKQRNRNYIKRTQMEITEVKQQYKSVLIGLITKQR